MPTSIPVYFLTLSNLCHPGDAFLRHANYLNVYTSIIYPANRGSPAEPYLDTLPSIIPEYRPVWLDTQNTTFTDTELLPYIYYPTWQVRVDGKRVAIYPGVGGQLAFSNPTHSSDVVAKQGHTLLENIATVLSLISLIIAIKLYVKN